MTKQSLKATALATALLLVSGAAHADNSVIETIFDEINLDLTSPKINATSVRDKSFKSNDPTIKSRAFKMKNGTDIKMVGRKLDKSTDINNITFLSIDLKQDKKKAEAIEARLSKAYGLPQKSRRNLRIWEVKNAQSRLGQHKKITIITGEENGQYLVRLDRRGVSAGNNPRLNKKSSKRAIKATQKRNSLIRTDPTVTD